MLNSTSGGNNGFLITLPLGVEALGQVTGVTGAPTRESHCDAEALRHWTVIVSATESLRCRAVLLTLQSQAAASTSACRSLPARSAASCVTTGSVLNCTINQPLNAGGMW